MLRRSIILSTVLAAAILSTVPAQAAWRIIKWNTTGVCQIWDFGLDGRPVPFDYRVMSRPLPSFAAALSAKQRLWSRGHCTL